MKKKNRVNHSSRECINKADKQNFIEQEENAEDNKIPDPDFNSSMVYLNIYDLDAVSKVVNTVARSVGAGAFHAGVEVYGYEYSFGYVVDGETGVTKTSARYHPYHVYRESIPMEEVDLLVEVMKLQWIGDTYDILSRNCLNYADYFCNLLDVGSIPDWVMSLQKKVTWVKSNLNVATTKLKELNKAAGIPTVINYIKKKYNENSDDYEGFKVTVKS
ncbi:PPPDE peptidase, putative [Plasmodium malariae]|uniref:PPPDE peptidase, putative n=1 Tax=Plasmodium malariae TaxID=5858 RepID=A0A1C3KY42_PLAMA|nr:PPPDE peptidase, putative [Plasmodium malariae]SBT79137.1 PPPDE peptidase, putative [Plasmodium malariae]SCN12102.1 PPPDE peptidase, putative [Plasmodium malariae]